MGTCIHKCVCKYVGVRLFVYISLCTRICMYVWISVCLTVCLHIPYCNDYCQPLRIGKLYHQSLLHWLHRYRNVVVLCDSHWLGVVVMLGLSNIISWDVIIYYLLNHKSVLYNDKSFVIVTCVNHLYWVNIIWLHILYSIDTMQMHFSHLVNTDRGSRKNGNGDNAASSAATLESKKRKGATLLTITLLI